jgi:hypothetical protein
LQEGLQSVLRSLQNQADDGARADKGRNLPGIDLDCRFACRRADIHAAVGPDPRHGYILGRWLLGRGLLGLCGVLGLRGGRGSRCRARALSRRAFRRRRRRILRAGRRRSGILGRRGLRGRWRRRLCRRWWLRLCCWLALRRLSLRCGLGRLTLRSLALCTLLSLRRLRRLRLSLWRCDLGCGSGLVT